MIKRKLCTHDIIKIKIPTDVVVSLVVVTRLCIMYQQLGLY